jgi:hypothetical protein
MRLSGVGSGGLQMAVRCGEMRIGADFFYKDFLPPRGPKITPLSAACRFTFRI